MSSQGPNLSGVTPDVVTNNVIVQGNDIYDVINNAVARVTPTSLGLSNVANTRPSDLPTSNATLSMIANLNGTVFQAINTKADIVNPTFQGTVSGITPAMVGLGNLYNTNQSYFTTSNVTVTGLSLFNVANTKPSDLPISTYTQSALNLKAPTQDPSFTGVVSTNNLKLYTKTLSNIGVIQHSNALQIAISSGTAPSSAEVFVTMDSSNLYLKAASQIYCLGDIAFSGLVSGLTASMVGLENVANTAASYFAPVNSPSLTGTLQVDGITKIFNLPDAATFLNTGNVYSVNGLVLQGGSTTALNLSNGGVSCNSVLYVGGRATMLSNLNVGGSTEISGDTLVKGTITTNQNVYLNTVGGKLGVFGGGITAAESSIQTAGLKTTLPSTLGIHLGMNSSTGDAGVSVVASNISQNSYLDFGYPGVVTKGKLVYNNTANSMLLYTNGSQRMTVDSNGNVGLGTATPTSCLHATGTTTNAFTTGVHIGQDPTSVNNTTVNLVAGTSSATCRIDFKTGGATASTYNGRILYNMNNNQMNFYAYNGYSFMVDGSQTLCPVVIGATASQGNTYRLYVNGAAYATGFTTLGAMNAATVTASGAMNAATLTTTGLVTCGSLSSGLPKNFDIVHPTKPGYRLRHRCLEGPLAYCVYPYQYQCEAGLNTFPLPDYFDALNKDVLVYVAPFRHFGAGWGESVGNNTLNITCSEAGLYNIQVVGTRDDPLMENVYQNEPVEYPDPAQTTV